ncbi:MAG TPA: hypothetical protein VMT16_05505 [Thermoanaerobaculia bacterium]|nr:hypothetical protein [Thermoanaerobaculia bacterium]
MARHDLEAVRGELQRMGYLTHRVERYLLQDAFRPQRPLGTVLHLAARLGLLGGALMALGSALLLAIWNPQVTAEPFDLLPLVLHLLPLWTLLFAAAFLLLAGVLALVLRLVPALRIDFLSFAVVAAGGGLLLGAALWAGRELLAPRSALQLGLLAAGAAAATYLMAKLLYHGLLALAIRLTERTPRRRLFGRRWLVAAVAACGALLVLLPAAVGARHRAPAAPAMLPTAPGGRVLLLGADGVVPAELEYLLARGELPQLARLAEHGALLSYDRPSGVPAAFWTTVATGLPSPQHGVAAVDSFRPLGMSAALSVMGPFRWYWDRVALPLGLASHRPVLANRRRAFALWELAARAGGPVVAVNWWATYPAAPLPGLVVAHGAYQLLADGTADAVAPTGRSAEVASLRRSEPPAEAERALAAALPAADAATLSERALAPDAFYRRLFAAAAPGTEAAALYLPGLDIAADGWRGSAVAFADLVRLELQALDGLLGDLLGDGAWDAVAVVFDPGRRGPAEGRVVLWRPAGCEGGEDRMAIERLAPALVAVLGLPASRQLAPPPEVCSWPRPPAVVDGFGWRTPPEQLAVPAEEYLENLRSLGYL